LIGGPQRVLPPEARYERLYVISPIAGVAANHCRIELEKMVAARPTLHPLIANPRTRHRENVGKIVIAVEHIIHKIISLYQLLK
jgi:hypothetical protein